MLIKQYYLDCLSHASYLIGDPTSGRAVVVDPQRDVQQYLDDATANGLTIERIIETHVHADFVSGHMELADRTGAVISYGAAETGRTEFEIDPLEDEQVLSLGNVELRILATPGHTPESICIVVSDITSGQPAAVLTGDTLFIGDVGRPDLLNANGMSTYDLAARLYESLHSKLLTLDDETLVYPAHGAGSACGKNLSTDTVSTIGEQRRSNYAVQPMSVEAFIEAVTSGQSAPPAYFAHAARRNQQGHNLFDAQYSVKHVQLDDVRASVRRGDVVLDVRSPIEFAECHLPSSINIGLEGRFAEYAGMVLRAGSPMIVIGANVAQVDEAAMRLARIGFDPVTGGFVIDPTAEVVEAAQRLSPTDLAIARGDNAAIQLIDIRQPSEVATGVIGGARHIPLAQLSVQVSGGLSDIDSTQPIVVYCAGGYRSSIAASLLRAHGFGQVSDLIGGITAWVGEGRPTVPNTTVEMSSPTCSV